MRTTHTRASTDAGPDFCHECSHAAMEWVLWPCPTSRDDLAIHDDEQRGYAQIAREDVEYDRKAFARRRRPSWADDGRRDGVQLVGKATTLTDFLLARIAEDEAVAGPDAEYVGTDMGSPYQPARVLAECEAKRRIVEQANFWDGDVSGHVLDWVARALALPYADHPDYDQAWKPVSVAWTDVVDEFMSLAHEVYDEVGVQILLFAPNAHIGYKRPSEVIADRDTINLKLLCDWLESCADGNFS